MGETRCGVRLVVLLGTRGTWESVECPSADAHADRGNLSKSYQLDTEDVKTSLSGSKGCSEDGSSIFSVQWRRDPSDEVTRNGRRDSGVDGNKTYHSHRFQRHSKGPNMAAFRALGKRGKVAKQPS